MINKILGLFVIIAKKVNIRLVITIFIIAIVFKIIFADLILKNIKKNTSSESILTKIQDVIKEGKHTMNVFDKIMKSTGLENVSLSDAIKKDYSKVQSSTVIKREDKLQNSLHRLIPLCGAEVDAHIIATNKKGEEFFNNDVPFKMGDITLPVGLERSLIRMSTSHVYEAVIPTSQLYFIDPPSKAIEGLKPTEYSDYIVYNISFNSVDKTYPVGNMEPRVFYLLHGAGAEIFCGDSVEILLSATDLKGQPLLMSTKYIINIGGDNILPHGLEHIVTRLRKGDKVSVMLNQDWLHTNKNEYKLRFPKQEYVIFDIAIMDIKQSVRAFQASKGQPIDNKSTSTKPEYNINDISSVPSNIDLSQIKLPDNINIADIMKQVKGG